MHELYSFVLTDLDAVNGCIEKLHLRDADDNNNCVKKPCTADSELENPRIEILVQQAEACREPEPPHVNRVDAKL